MSERNEFCERVFYGTFEVVVFLISFFVIGCYWQSRQMVIEHISPPKVMAVTAEYLDVEWHNRRLLDCPTTGTPAFYTPLATEYLNTRPVASGLEETRFVRRYHFPAHLLELHRLNADPDIDYIAELQVHIEAHCNPLWETRQMVRVPFKMVQVGE